MKPLRLGLRGFTAFRDRVVLDFRDRTLFAITGPTGAGKSSLLDAMTWALYGQVPRVGNATKQLVTHGAKRMDVQLEFAARGEVYRVARSTAGQLGSRLEVRDADGSWRLLADRATGPEGVNAQVVGILGLDYGTFTKTIVLPQGEFQSFMRGDAQERRRILNGLLGLDAYIEAGKAARSRAGVAKAAREMLAAQIERLTLASPEALAALEAQRVELERRAADAEAQRTRLAALQQLAEASTNAERERTRAAEQATEAARALEVARASVLEAEQSHAQTFERATAIEREIAALAYDADAHEQLRRVAESLEQRRRAEAELAEARTALDVARVALESSERVASEAAAASEVAERAAEEARGRLEGALAALASAAAAGRETSAHLEADIAAAERARTESEARAAEQETLASRVDALAERARTLAAERTRVAAAMAEADTALAAATAQANAAAVRLTEAETAAEAARAHLEASRREQAAAALRSGLKPGDPCPVCGEPITDVAALAVHTAPELDAAESAVREAVRVLEEARNARGAADTAVAAREAARAGAASEGERVESALAVLATDAQAAGLAASAIDEASLALAVASARAAATEARAVAATHFAAIERDGKFVRAFEVLLSKVPETLPEPVAAGSSERRSSKAVALATDPLEAGTALRAALDAHTAADTESRAASEAARAATAEAQRLADAVRHAADTLVQREAAVAGCEKRLAALGPVEVGQEPEQVAKALAEADAAKQRHDALEAECNATKQAVAVLAGQIDERRGVEAQAVTRAEQVAAALEAATAAAAGAHEAFAAAWRDTLGEDHQPEVAVLETVRQRLDEDVRAIDVERGTVNERTEQAGREAEQAAQFREEITGHERTMRVAGALEQELQADRFIAYIHREALGVLAADASARLQHLTSDRYRLTTDDGGDFAVIDQLNGDERRSVKTLSGGETFLASLALALALSERLPELAGSGGAVSLESLFLDEGFGSLDAAALDIAIEGLERLAGGRRMIGVISHVPEIAERLPDRVQVVKSPEGSRIMGASLRSDDSESDE